MSCETIQSSVFETFYEQELITDVLHAVKSGKEATVYCCRAHPSTGTEFLAAKGYRPRQVRSFKNDAVYQQGRAALLRPDRRAYTKRTKYGGSSIPVGTWIGSDFETHVLFHEAGADVPVPIALSSDAILMEYVGDADSAAPLLHHVSLEPDEARRLLGLAVRNVELFLSCYRVHADLSAFNILYWQGALKIIDFPQSVDVFINGNAFALLMRDIENVCKHFARQGVEADPFRIGMDLWTRFTRGGS